MLRRVVGVIQEASSARALLRALVAGAGVGLCLSNAAHADDAAPAGLDRASERELSEMREMSLEQLMAVPLSTGSFLELDMKSSPVSLTFIDRAQIKASAARTLSELLEIYVPGFQYMINKWNGEIWGMRGVATDRNTKFVFLVNGLKQNTESRDGAYTELDLGLLDDIERVEVLRGPAGLVYGSGAIAGVINLVTRRPAVTGGSIATSYGSGNSISGEALAHAQLDAWTLTVAGGYRRASGLGNQQTRIYGEPSFPTALDENFQPVPLEHGAPADGSMGRTPGNYRMSADISYRDLRWYSRMTHRETAAGPYYIVDGFPELVGFPPDDAPPRTIDGKLMGPDGDLWRTESFGTNRREYVVDNFSSDLRYTPSIGADKLTLEAAFIAAQNRITDAYRKGYAVNGAPDPAGRIVNSMGERRYYLSAQYLLKRFRNVESASGASLRVDDIGRDWEGINMYNAVADHKQVSDVVYTNVALYNETHYLPIETLRLVAGLRMDKHTRTSYVFTAKGGAVYTPRPAHTIKLFAQSAANNGSADNYEYNYNHYQNDGSIQQTTHLSDGPTSTVPTQAIPAVTTGQLHSLKPERAYSVELASTHTLLDALTLLPSVSYTRIRDLFEWSPEFQRSVNTGAYSVLSLELDLRADVRAIHLTLGASHVYQRALALDDRPRVYQLQAWEPVPVDGGLWDVRETGMLKDVPINSVRDQVTKDGKNFLNLSSNITKLYLDYRPVRWLLIHTDARIFWGLPGRKESIDAGNALGANYLGIQRLPIIKWNLGVRFLLPQGFALGAHVYNLLASSRNRNAVRWQVMAEPDQRDLYTVDLRYFAGMLEKEF